MSLKEGVGEDFANKDKIAGLLRFASTHADTADETVSLADYVAPDEGGPGQDLLRDGGYRSTPRATARISRSSAARASRCCCCPIASTNGSSAT